MPGSACVAQPSALKLNSIRIIQMDYDGNNTFIRARNAIVGAILVFLLVLAIGTLGYKYFGGEAVSWLDALYMTFLMVATIGYGAGIDVYHQPDREIFTMLIAFSGIGIMTYFFSSVTALVLASDFDKSLRRRRMDKQLKKVRGHFILCGFGRVGSNVARELGATQRHFVAIDEDLHILESHAERHPGMLYLVGDASDEDLLEEANIAQAQGVFAVTGDDSRNLMITLTSKQIAPHVRVVARSNDVRNGEKMRKAGADSVVSPDFTGGMRIASAMLRPHVVSFLDEMLRSESHLRVEEIPIHENFSPCVLSEIHLSRSSNYVVLAVRIGSQWQFNPASTFELHPGHVLIAMATPQGRQELEQALSAR
jgi:voltage-gated potassium channel